MCNCAWSLTTLTRSIYTVSQPYSSVTHWDFVNLNEMIKVYRQNTKSIQALGKVYNLVNLVCILGRDIIKKR